MERDYPSDVRDAARIVFCVFCPLLLSLRIIFAEGGDAGKLADFVAAAAQAFGHVAGLALSIIKLSDTAKGFVLLARRWVVERTFGWLVKARRLVRDHERNPRHHEAFVYLAMIGQSARHLAASNEWLWIFNGQALRHNRPFRIGWPSP